MEYPGRNWYKISTFLLLYFISICLAFYAGTTFRTVQNGEANRPLNIPQQLKPTRAYPTSLPTISMSKEVISSMLEVVGPAPEWSGLTSWHNGGPYSLAQLRGKPIIMVICTPTIDTYCSYVVPQLNVWQELHRNNGLYIIWINTPYPVHTYPGDSEYLSKSIAFARDHGMNFPFAQDANGSIKDTYKVSSWPQLIFIDKNGIMYNPKSTGKTKSDFYSGYDDALKMLMAL